MRPDAAHARPTAGLYRRWIRACALGELAGFVPPAATGALLVVAGAPEAILVLGLVVAGGIEGAIIGLAQARVINQALPGVSGWVRATSAAAGIAWLAGMGGSSLVQSVGAIALIVVVPAWMFGLLAMGVLQSRRLEGKVRDPNRWIIVTSTAWLVGVMLPVVVLSVIPNNWPIVVHVVAAVAAAVAMGATVGAISGPTLKRFTLEANFPAKLPPAQTSMV